MADEKEAEAVYTIKATGDNVARVGQLLDMLIGPGTWRKNDAGYEVPVTAQATAKIGLVAQATSRLPGVSLPTDAAGKSVSPGMGAVTGQAQAAPQGPPLGVPRGMPQAPTGQPTPAELQHRYAAAVAQQAQVQYTPPTPEQSARRNVLRARGKYGRRTTRVNVRPHGMAGSLYVIRWARVNQARAWTVARNLDSIATGMTSELIGAAGGFSRKEGFMRACDIVLAHVTGEITAIPVFDRPEAPKPWKVKGAPTAVFHVEDGDEDGDEVDDDEVQVPAVAAPVQQVYVDELQPATATVAAEPAGKSIPFPSKRTHPRWVMLDQLNYQDVQQLHRKLPSARKADSRKKADLIDAICAWEWATGQDIQQA